MSNSCRELTKPLPFIFVNRIKAFGKAKRNFQIHITGVDILWERFFLSLSIWGIQ